MSIIRSLQNSTIESLNVLFGQSFTENDFQVNQTKPEFEGDYTVVMFSLVKSLRKSPDEIGNLLGTHLIETYPELFSAYNIIKGFLNLSIANDYWLALLQKNHDDICFGKHPMNGKKVMVEYSSPNTNKPLHLGHLRNNFLGWSVAEILKASGNEVLKSCIVNDRGIHICKSMLAWQLDGQNKTPETTGIKGDHLVGDFYVMAEGTIKKQASEILEKVLEKNDYSDFDAEGAASITKLADQYRQTDLEKEKEKKHKLYADIVEQARKQTAFMKATSQMLNDWEAGKPEVIALWKKMNSWVYSGFDITYKNIGSDFDKMYYESDTYLLGKDVVQQGLEKNIFYRKPDNSVWIDLTNDGLDEKLVLRKDGTSVYITQDIGLAIQKYEQYQIDKSIYVIGDEQNYHMKVLQLISKRLGLPYADDIHHLSYGMVELPTGKMKSREGTVVDADDIVSEMEHVAQEKTEELGKVKDFTSDELKSLYHNIGAGALKFFLLRVDPKKKMIFNPEESIDFHGFTGPFIQFNYARIKSILRKNNLPENAEISTHFLPLEKELIVALEKYPSVISQAAEELNPSAIAMYIYHVAKTFSSFYTEHSIANAESEEKKTLRLMIANMTANVIGSGMHLLGITVPERM